MDIQSRAAVPLDSLAARVTAGLETSEAVLARDGVVYVVDDDHAFLRSMERLLGAVGYAVRLYSTAQEFFVEQRRGEPECLLLDLRMPGVSGIQLQDRLLAGGDAIPIVFLSGHADLQSGIHAMKSGAVDFLAKPFTEDELLAAVSGALTRDRCARERRRAREEARARLARLTPRERQVCDLVATGLLNKQIAGELGAAEKTIKCHRGRVMEKLAVGSVAELVRLVDLARMH